MQCRVQGEMHQGLLLNFRNFTRPADQNGRLRPLTRTIFSMTTTPMQHVHVIGGGLAGTEAAWQVARRGIPVTIHEMRPQQTTAAHKTGDLAELVCSNSFR